ncbi:hypothetical protein HX099_11430 [Thiopseudomonas alkaliphila]|uniref:Uncharacterized protein n=1 Tax=Thiopseudomonas alkaliphila TaxID=1697053 RepID=A0AAW7DUE8_9GAMM|nr:hypothetical protein [Thiopseudomonas alkaliphila]MDM1697262.1 hypothetical protein [Thiopseudomonas alkaliphila]
MLGLLSAGIALGSGLLSTVGAAIGSACSAIGGAVLSTGGVLLDAISRGLPVVEKICDIALAVGKGVGLFSPEQSECDMYELGMRAERSVEEGVHSEQFDSNQAYIDHLREEIELGKEDLDKLDKLSDEDKLKYACIGSAVTIAGIKEQFKIDIPETFWLASIDVGIGREQIKPMLDVFEQEQVKPDIDGFLNGGLPSDLQHKIYDLIDSRLGEVLGNEIIEKLLN